MTDAVPATSYPLDKVSAIVPTIGRPASLRRLLQSLAQQTLALYEIIVADGSDNPEIERLINDPIWQEQGLTVTILKVRPAHAVRQRRAAIEVSTGDLLLFLDDDVILEPDCVERLVRAMVVNSDAVAAMAMFSNQPWPRPSTVWRWYLRFVLRIDGEEWQGRVVGPLLRFGYDPNPNVICDIEWMGAGNSLIRRESYQSAGGFSDFFLHRCTVGEDIDLSIKLKRFGRILYCPSARMQHIQAPGGRLPTDKVAEDDLFNRFLILHVTKRLSKTSAFQLVCVFCIVETAGHLLGAVRRMHFRGVWLRFCGRTRALTRIWLRYFFFALTP